jgi:hypothetical protein
MAKATTVDATSSIPLIRQIMGDFLGIYNLCIENRHLSYTFRRTTFHYCIALLTLVEMH